MLARGVIGAFALSLLAALTAAGPASSAPRDCPDCPKTVILPPGAFQMGAPGGEPGRPEGPVRTVTIAKPFAMGLTEVTNRQYAAFVKATGYEVAGPCRTLVDGSFQNSPAHDWRKPGPGMSVAPDEPVVCVSWRDAQAYVAWLTKKTGQPYRLPTEAEWEYAARAGSPADFAWGDDPEASCAYGNLYDAAAAGLKLSWAPLACGDGAAFLSKVGAYKPNAFGLYDMVGNVWEWTQDCYVAPYPATPTDGSALEVEGACERRTVRGGAWMTRADRARSSFRGRDPEPARFAYFGFRVARDLGPR